jgi:hypothetical protein
MTLAQILLALHLVQLTGSDNQLVLINPDEVVGLREPRGSGTHFHQSVRCLIFTADGKHTAVVESCDQVRQKLER